MAGTTVLLMHMDDAAFSDACGNTVTINGQVDLAPPLPPLSPIYYNFNGYAVQGGPTGRAVFTDGGSTLTVPVPAEGWLGTRTLWCIEGTVEDLDESSPYFFFSIQDSTGATVFALRLLAVRVNTFPAIYIPGTVSHRFDNIPLSNWWGRIAVVRNGATLRVYFDGVDSGFAIAAPTDMRDAGGAVTFGGDPNGAFIGTLDEWRVTIDDPVYTANYTPASAPFTYTAPPVVPHVTGSATGLLKFDLYTAGQAAATLKMVLATSGQAVAPLGLDLHTTGQPVAPLELFLTSSSQPYAVLALDLFTQGQAAAPLALDLVASGAAGASMEMDLVTTDMPAAVLALDLVATGANAALLETDLAASGSASAVLEADLAATGQGAATLQFFDGPWFGDTAQVWGLVVIVGGVDVSARLTGAGSIEWEEGSARIAEFRLLPGDAATDPSEWVGLVVTVDIACGPAQSAGVATSVRRFTGVVDVPQFDPVSRITTLRCTDDLQAVVGRLTQAQITALLPDSLYSWAISGTDPARFVFYSLAEAWTYAQERLATLPGHLDLDAARQPRYTPWAPKVAPDIAYGIDDINDGTLSAEISHRGQIKNMVRITFTHRFPRCKCRVVATSYAYPFSYADIMRQGYSIPTRAMVKQALTGTGWELVAEPEWTPIIPGSTLVNLGSNSDGTTSQGYYVMAPQDAVSLTTGFAAALKKRYVQWVDAQSQVVVRLPGSVAALGEKADTLSGSVAVAFDASAWESRPTALPLVSVPGQGEAWTDYAGSATDQANAAIALAVLQAKASVIITGSHRRNFVSAEVDFDVRLDLDKTVSVSTPRLSATGKVRSVSDTWNLETGKIATRFSLALAEVYGNGVPPEPTLPVQSTPPVRPTGPFTFGLDTHVGGSTTSGALQDAWQGYFCNVTNTASSIHSASAPVYPVQFKATAPAIEAAARDNLTLITPVIVNVALTADPFDISG